MFLKHPYRFNTLGNENNVAKFDNDALFDFYNEIIRPENMVISIVGDVDSKKILNLANEKFGTMKSGSFKKLKLENEPVATEIREKIQKEQDKAQMHIIIGFQAPNIYDEDKYAFEVMNSIMAGQGGRLFLELRDKQSLAYTVTSFHTPGLETGYFGVYIGTAPQKEQEAIEGIKNQLALLLKDGVSDDELNRAKSYIVGNFEIGLQKNSSQAAKIGFDELYDIGWDEYKSYPQKILDVTKDDVLKVARKYIDLDKYTIAIVKPE
ncbi:MAG: hypothetical protein GTO02_07505 [Candidatus Dadabacteria bacterium]|nr:hypothetical protein [Candidatus Dadabacteria bacterium]NIQ14242.1 hypothetical protein [Candidatus Dadabacteria bacterium]